MTQQEKEMLELLKRAAYVLAEAQPMTPQITVLRSKIVAKIIELSPEYYGLPA